MQAIKAYYDEGKFVPFKPIKIPKGSHAIVTILDFPIDEGQHTIEEGTVCDDSRVEWLNRLNDAIRLSMDEDLPDFPRIKTVREHLNLGE